MPEDIPSALCRAVDLLQAVFYAWREARLHWKLHDYKADGDKLRVYVSYLSTGTMDGIRGVFDTFPELHRHSPEGRAILAFCGCDDPMSYLSNICQKIFDTIDMTVEEIAAEMLTSLKYVVEHNVDKGGGEDQTSYEHSFYRVLTASGQRFAIDLSCAQYGIQQPVMVWHEYMDKFVEDVKEVNGFGSHEEGTSNSALWLRAMANDMDWAVNAWEIQHVSLADLLQLEEAEYQKSKESLADEIKCAVKAGLRNRFRLWNSDTGLKRCQRAHSE